MLCKQATLYLINRPHIFFEKVKEQLMHDNESYQSYCINIFNGICWGEPIIVAALSHMWNVPISIITATKYHLIKLFHESNESSIVLIANGYYGTSAKCTHYAATELITPDQNKKPGGLTPYDDLVPVNLTNQLEAQKAALSYVQRRTQDHIPKEYKNISTGMVILKKEIKKMETQYEKLELMQTSLLTQMKALGLEVSQAKNIKKTLLPTQETQTDIQDITEQQAAISSITTPTVTAPTPQQYELPDDLHEFIQHTGKLDTQYHTEDYILTIQQSSTGECILSIEEKSDAASNTPLTQLSAQDIMNIVNVPKTPSKLPGTQMTAVPSTSEDPSTSKEPDIQHITPTQPKPGSSQQPDFTLPAPELPKTSPSILEYAQTLLKKHAPNVIKPKEATAAPSKAPKLDDNEEEIQIIDDDDNNDEQQTECTEKPKYVTRSHVKAIPPQLQNPKRSYCECSRSYTRASNLKCHKLDCGKTPRYPFVCPQCPSKYMLRTIKKRTCLQSALEEGAI